MNTLLVGYDLHKPRQEYEAVWDVLRAMGTWWHHLDSTWIVRTELTPVQLRTQLRQLVDGDDEILVIDVSGRSWAGYGFEQRAYDWLKKNM